jgi:hypothetical protein
MATNGYKIISGYGPCHLVKRRSYVIAVMMGTGMVPEPLVVFDELTRLLAQKDFINFTAILIYESEECGNGRYWRVDAEVCL